MEQEERKLVEKILGRDFLNAAETYGRNMRIACAAQGASETVQSAFERIATVAFCKGAEFYRDGEWHQLENGYPPLDKWLLLSNGGSFFVGRVVKGKNGSLYFQNEDEEKIPKPRYWMLPPDMEDQESKGKTVPLKK